MRTGSSRLWPALLAALVLLPALGFLPRLLGEPTPLPLDRRPTWAQAVVITCDRIPRGWNDGTTLAELERRAARGAVRLPGSTERAARALWSGRSVAEGAPWTVAEAVRRAGGRTAAFLDEPLVARSALPGFGRVVEDPGLGPTDLAELFAERLEGGGRTLTWLHLETAGDPEALAALLGGVHRALDDAGHRWDAVVLVTALAGGDDVAPLWAELPSALYADRAGRGTAPVTDVAGLLLQLLRVPGPDVTLGERPVESTGALATLLQGGAVAAGN